MLSIPGLTRGTDPTIPKQVLKAKLKAIDKRRAEIEALLNHGPNEDDYCSQELNAERQALGLMRAEIDEVLNPKPTPARSPELQKLYEQQRQRDVEFLRVAIRHEIQNTEYAAQREEQAGNFRAAKLHRLTIPEIPERVCKEFGKDLSLLAKL
jgi:hypothetical protein